MEMREATERLKTYRQLTILFVLFIGGIASILINTVHQRDTARNEAWTAKVELRLCHAETPPSYDEALQTCVDELRLSNDMLKRGLDRQQIYADAYEKCVIKGKANASVAKETVQ